jgi:hypothetical protein
VFVGTGRITTGSVLTVTVVIEAPVNHARITITDPRLANVSISSTPLARVSVSDQPLAHISILGGF